MTISTLSRLLKLNETVLVNVQDGITSVRLTLHDPTLAAAIATIPEDQRVDNLRDCLSVAIRHWISAQAGSTMLALKDGASPFFTGTPFPPYCI